MPGTRSKRKMSSKTYRMRVLAVIEANGDTFHTGQQIAEITGLTYRQTIDALNALNNMEKIARTGRKFTARWGKLPQKSNENPALLLQSAFRGFFA